jgi:hypothetical protein
MQTCFETKSAGYPVKLEQSAGGKFRVTYGQLVSPNLTYEEAANQLGACIMHAAACEGKLDNDA